MLALNARQLPYDWEEKYHIKPVLMESFVEKNRFAGTCYKAANWCNVGQTKEKPALVSKDQAFSNYAVKLFW
ncbi:MAG: DUF4338 domain-containing protein [Deltaproteobacteria bacterium]|nr:DUF4338 domain-containing protein [Deltaproteobacteria bacterium]